MFAQKFFSSLRVKPQERYFCANAESLSHTDSLKKTVIKTKQLSDFSCQQVGVTTSYDDEDGKPAKMSRSTSTSGGIKFSEDQINEFHEAFLLYDNR